MIRRPPISTLFPYTPLFRSAVTEPIRRLNLEWDLYGYPETPAMARDAMPVFFAETLALPDPKVRVEQLRWVLLAAQHAGLFSIQREAQDESLMTAVTTKDLEASALSYRSEERRVGKECRS